MFLQFSTTDDTPTIKSEPHNTAPCYECRKKKLLCSKELPTCRRCARDNIQCSYALTSKPFRWKQAGVYKQPPRLSLLRVPSEGTRANKAQRKPLSRKTSFICTDDNNASYSNSSGNLDAVSDGGFDSPILPSSPPPTSTSTEFTFPPSMDLFTFAGLPSQAAAQSRPSICGPSQGLGSYTTTLLVSSPTAPTALLPSQAALTQQQQHYKWPPAEPAAPGVPTRHTLSEKPPNGSCSCDEVMVAALREEAQVTAYIHDNENAEALFVRLVCMRDSTERLRGLVACNDCLASRKSVMLLLVLMDNLVRQFQQLVDSVPRWCFTGAALPVGMYFETVSSDEISHIACVLLEMYLHSILQVLCELGTHINGTGWSTQVTELSSFSMAITRMQGELRI